MSFSRWWTEAMGVVDDTIGAGAAMLLLVLAAVLTALLWYFFPAWVPRRLPRLPRLGRPRLPKLRFRRRKRVAKPKPAAAASTARTGDALPAVPAAELISLADRYAAEGRWAEAVRERHRAMVRALVDRRVIENHPEWTVTELAGAAARARPALDRPLRDAGAIFSDVWYGERTAEPAHDERMRRIAGELDGAL